MAVTVNIGTTDDAVNVISKKTSLGEDILASLKQPCSVENPVFILSTSLISTTDNYLYCKEFKRYYYITEITGAPGQLCYVSCSVDPLKSYEEQIRALKVNVSRTENADFSNLTDSSLATLAKDEVVFLNLNGSIPTATGTDRTYVLIVSN